MKQATSTVHIFHAEQAGLFAPEATGIDSDKVNAEYFSLHARQQAADFLATQDGGKLSPCGVAPK